MKKKLPKKQNRSQKIENAKLAKATGGLRRNVRRIRGLDVRRCGIRAGKRF